MDSEHTDPSRVTGGRLRQRQPVILVVDDSEDNRDLYAMALGRAGYAVAVAVDGLDAVDKTQAIGPTLILMDLAMPNLDGWEATKRIRALPDFHRATKIIALTAFTDAVSVQRARAAGCDAVLSKPCPPATLLEHIAVALASIEAVNDTDAREIA